MKRIKTRASKHISLPPILLEILLKLPLSTCLAQREEFRFEQDWSRRFEMALSEIMTNCTDVVRRVGVLDLVLADAYILRVDGRRGDSSLLILNGNDRVNMAREESWMLITFDDLKRGCEATTRSTTLFILRGHIY